jgi:hypothetical protein
MEKISVNESCVVLEVDLKIAKYERRAEICWRSSADWESVRGEKPTREVKFDRAEN